MNILETWGAGFTRRWHANPAMAHVVDTVDAHSARVERLVMCLWPDAGPQLTDAAMFHDLAESVVGDIPPAAKRLIPAFDVVERAIAIEKGWFVPLDEVDEARLRLADRLDAYLIVRMHAPDELGRSDWLSAADWIAQEGWRLGVWAQIEAVMA